MLPDRIKLSPEFVDLRERLERLELAVAMLLEDRQPAKTPEPKKRKPKLRGAG